MRTDRIITVVAFALAGVSVCEMYTKNGLVLLVIFCVMCILVLLMGKIEKILNNSQGEFLDKCCYLFSRNKDGYIQRYQDACYTYITKDEMEYSKSIDVVAKVNNLDRIEEKYAWSSYGKNVKVEPIVSEQEISGIVGRNLWTRFEILFNKRLRKNNSTNTGFKVHGLKDELGIAKPFLALETDKKIKERRMSVKIPKELKPKNAKFEIYAGSLTGPVLKSENLEYDERIKGYQKNIKYPRMGRIYCILWEWEENN